MKRNLFFLGILIRLIVFTYFFEEKKSLTLFTKKTTAESVLDFGSFGDLREIKTTSFKLSFDKDRFYTSKQNYQVDPDKLELILSVLSHLKVKRVLSSDEIKKFNEKEIFPLEDIAIDFSFQKGSLRAVLGIKNRIDDSFYFKIKKSNDQKTVWFLVYDDSAFEGVYSDDESQTGNAKYQRLYNLLKLNEEFFFDIHPLKNRDKIQKISIENLRNRPFEVYFQEKRFVPNLEDGLSFSEEKSQLFIDALLSEKAKNLIFNPKFSDLREPLAQISFSFSNSLPLKLELFRTYGREHGYFLKSSQENILFIMNQSVTRFFFSNFQDFIDKTLSRFFSLSFNLVLKENSSPLALDSAATQKISTFFKSEALYLEKKENPPSNAQLTFIFKKEKDLILINEDDSEMTAYLTQKKILYHYSREHASLLPLQTMDSAK